MFHSHSYHVVPIKSSSIAIAALAFLAPRTTPAFPAPCAPRHQKSSLFNQINNEATVDRRTAINQLGKTATSITILSLLSPEDALAVQDYDDSKAKRILITGSNSGIGLDAAQRMALRGHEIILACVSRVLSACLPHNKIHSNMLTQNVENTRKSQRGCS